MASPHSPILPESHNDDDKTLVRSLDSTEENAWAVGVFGALYPSRHPSDVNPYKEVFVRRPMVAEVVFHCATVYVGIIPPQGSLADARFPLQDDGAHGALAFPCI